MRFRTKTQDITARLVAGWLVLLLYVCAASPVGSAVVAFIGSLDRDHQLQVACGDAGVSLVLHHNGGCAQHHHGLTARMLTMLSNADTASDPDHIIHFAQQVTAAKSSEDNAPTPSALESFALASNLATSPHALSAPLFQTTFGHPPADGGRAPCIRTTVLLI